MFAKIDITSLGTSRKANILAVSAGLAVSMLAAMAALHLWLAENPARSLEASLPGTDGRPANLDTEESVVELRGTLLAFDGAPADLPGYWPWFRGPGSDNIHQDGAPLASAWGPDGPRELWSVELGEGFAGPAVLNGCVYLLDYDEEARADTLRCFSLADGREIWRRSYAVMIKRNHGMSRTVPAVTEKYIVTVGPKCHVVCLDTATGDFRWGIDLQAEYGTDEPL